MTSLFLAEPLKAYFPKNKLVGGIMLGVAELTMCHPLDVAHARTVAGLSANPFSDPFAGWTYGVAYLAVYRALYLSVFTKIQDLNP